MTVSHAEPKVAMATSHLISRGPRLIADSPNFPVGAAKTRPSAPTGTSTRVSTTTFMRAFSQTSRYMFHARLIPATERETMLRTRAVLFCDMHWFYAGRRHRAPHVRAEKP